MFYKIYNIQYSIWKHLLCVFFRIFSASKVSSSWEVKLDSFPLDLFHLAWTIFLTCCRLLISSSKRKTLKKSIFKPQKTEDETYCVHPRGRRVLFCWPRAELSSSVCRLERPVCSSLCVTWFCFEKKI